MSIIVCITFSDLLSEQVRSQSRRDNPIDYNKLIAVEGFQGSESSEGLKLTPKDKDKLAKLNADAKSAFSGSSEGRFLALVDPEKLATSGKVFWREGLEGVENKREIQAFINLERLTENYPEFIPGHLKLAEAANIWCPIKGDDNSDPSKNRKWCTPEKAIESLEKGSSLYPERKDLLDARLTAFSNARKFLEASIAARQFSIGYPKDTDASKYRRVAEEYLALHRKDVADKLFSLNLASYLTGGFSEKNSSGAQVSAVMLQGEKAYGESVFKEFKKNNTLVDDQNVANYVNKVGQKLAKLMGRDEFDYEFVVPDNQEAKAFTYPGGKVAITTGMLLTMNTEAELAGVLGHEIAHSVFSHSFTKLANNLAAESWGRLFGLEDIFKIMATENSRGQERQSDILATRVVSAAGYASDGIWSLMVRSKRRPTPYFSEHPSDSERIEYLQDLITRNNYSRFAFNGVRNHIKIRQALGDKSFVSSTVSTPVGNVKILGFAPETTTKPSNNNRNPSPNRRVVGKVPLEAKITKDKVAFRLDGAVARTGAEFTVNVLVQNDSKEKFGFVPFFVRVIDAKGKILSNKFVSKNGTIAEPGGSIRGELTIYGKRWDPSGKQDLILEVTEGTSGGRLFRIAF